MAYIKGEREQAKLFPASLEEYVGVHDPVRVYDAFVDQLDFKDLGIVLNEQQVGPPEFDPRAMMKLLMYGYAYRDTEFTNAGTGPASQCQFYVVDGRAQTGS